MWLFSKNLEIELIVILDELKAVGELVLSGQLNKQSNTFREFSVLLGSWLSWLSMWPQIAILKIEYRSQKATLNVYFVNIY